MKDALYNLPKATVKIRKLHLPTFENVEAHSDLQGERIEKFIKVSKIIDIYTKLEILSGINLSGHSHTLTEASNLNDELCKRGEVQNEHQYRNAPNLFQT